MTVLAKDPCHEGEPALTLPGMPRSRGCMAQRPKIEPNKTGGENITVMMPNDILLYSQTGA